jgi:uncharacterized membrane protein
VLFTSGCTRTMTTAASTCTNGLFGWQEVWSGTPQAVAGFNELAALFSLLALLARPSPRTPARPRRTVSSALESDAGSPSVRTAAAPDTDER